MAKYFFIVLLFFFTQASFAQTDAPGAAEDAVRVFYSSLSNEAEDLGETELSKEITKRRDQVLSEISSIRITESPGEKRYDKVYRVFESATGMEVDSLRRSIGWFGPKKKAKADESVKRLARLREDKLKEIEKTLQYEISSEERLTPPPPISGPPFTSERDISPAVPRLE